ncbi:MAG: uroporphyrinogen decarboxylase, partial [Burkholderiales bacterium]|nr:uroporphyrinogen decarboxylase [Burkholderiales bacterium]
MARIDRVESALYRIPLPTVLTDSTHGTMRDFELAIVDIHDADGAVGTGYTFTVGANGRAAHVTVVHDLAPVLVGRDADAIEARWREQWWAV